MCLGLTLMKKESDNYKLFKESLFCYWRAFFWGDVQEKQEAKGFSS